MPIAGGILVAGSASRCLSSAAGMLRFLARLSGRRRHERRSCRPGGGSGCCGAVQAGETRGILGTACISGSECGGGIGNTAETTTTTTMTTGTSTTRNATATTTTTTTTTTRIGDNKSRFEARTNDQTIDRIQDSRWTPVEVSIERLSCESCCYEESCSHRHYSPINRSIDEQHAERNFELSRRLDLEPPLETLTQRLTSVEPRDQLDKYWRLGDTRDNDERISRRLRHRLHSHRNNKHSVPPVTSSSTSSTSSSSSSTLVVEPSLDETATTTITTTATTTATTTTTTILTTSRTRTRNCVDDSDEGLVDDDNSLKFRRQSSISSSEPTIFHNEIQQRELDGRNQRNLRHPDNSSFSNTSYTRRRTFPPYLATLLIISYTLFGIADACSSRSTPKPRPPTPTPRPNITFHMYTCPPDYAEWYCLNGATCFTVKIQESLLYNCLCANGFIGQRCEFKDLDGSYLPSRQRVMLETASIAGGATIAVFLVVIICIAAYIHCKRKQKELRTSSTCVDTVDGPGRDPELRPFSNRSRSLMIFMAKNPNGSTMCPSIEQTRMPGWSDYSRTETARMASVNEEKRGSSQQ